MCIALNVPRNNLNNMAETSSESVEIFTLPSSLYEAGYLSRSSTLHNGMMMFANSVQAHRAPNQAIIFLYGLSGAGKTSSLNHIFGFEVIKIVNKFKADTNSVTEYIATMKSEVWGVNNLQINFIDMPGWSDSGGEEADIRNMALIDQFLLNHDTLGSKIYKCYPNIVTIVIDPNDRRLNDKDARVVRMFRALNKLNVIDKERPNVLIILTHVDSVGKKSFTQLLNEIIGILGNLVKCYLHCIPTIVYLENSYEELELRKSGDWTILKDGTLQPKNVFDGMIYIMEKQRDEIGHEAVRIYFTSRGNNKPIKKQYECSQPNQNQIMKWSIIIKEEFLPFQLNEVSIAFQEYAKSKSDHFSVHALVQLIVQLDRHALTQISTLQTMGLNQIQKRLHHYRMSKLEIQALVMACGVKPYQFDEISRIIGCGMKTQSGEILNNSVLELETSWHIQDGVRLPKCMHIVVPKFQYKRRIQWKLCEKKKKQTNISEIDGYTVVKITHKYQFQVFHPIYSIRLNNEDGQLSPSHLSTAFEDAVLALPNTNTEEGNAVKSDYVDFLNKYGEQIVVGCEFGGILQGEVQMDELEFINSQKHLEVYIENVLDMLETEAMFDAKQFEDNRFLAEMREFNSIFNKTILEWKGGEVCAQSLTFNNLTPEVWLEWINSLYKSPIVLRRDTKMSICHFISLISIDISEQVELACANTYGNPTNVEHDKLVSEIIQEIHTRESAARNSISKTIWRANIGFPDTSTIIQKTRENYTTRLISEINVGDRVLCKSSHGSEFKEVLEVNCSQREEH